MNIKEFTQLVDKQQKETLKRNYSFLDVERTGAKYVPGKKYDKVNIISCGQESGRYMIDKETKAIYGIKRYGTVNLRHLYGTLDTVNDWYWGEYRAFRITK